MNLLKIWFEATRPKTLPAAVAPVLLGTAMAYQAGAMRLIPAFICLGFALLVQVGTNFANDYLDGIRGTDTEARLGPQRAVAGGLVSPDTMRWAALGTLAVAFCLGLSLIAFGGWWLLAVGVASVACAWFYTGGPYPLAYNGLGDVFVVLFFGVIAVGGTFYVQTGDVSMDVIWLGLACGLIVNNILVVNNYRDIVEDRQARKLTLVVILGRQWARIQYALSLFLAGGILVWFVTRDYSAWILLGVLPLLFGFYQLWQLRVANDAVAFQAALKGTALIVVGYAFSVSFGLLMGQ